MKHGATIILPDGTTYKVTQTGDSDAFKQFVKACSDIHQGIVHA